MKRASGLGLGLALLLVAPSVGSIGCVGGGARGQVQLTWAVTDEAGGMLSCQPNDRVVVSVGEVVSDFPCAAMAGTTPPVAAGRYNVDITLFDEQRTPLNSAVMQIDVVAGQVVSLGHVPLIPPGVAAFSWELRSMASGTPASCAVGEEVIVDFGGGYFFRFPCSALAGTTGLIVPGTYNVMPSLAAGSEVRSRAQPVPVTVPAGRASADYHIVFTVLP